MSNDLEYEAGMEVLSFCGKCKMPLAHLIIAVDEDGDIDRCECQTCGAVHKYRNPEGPKKRASTSKTPKKENVPPETMWKEAIAKAKGSTKPYAMTAAFEQGDLIDHPAFGKGIVEELIDQKKMTARFENGPKILACNR